MTARLTDAAGIAREIADAVLFEGYMLYPYRANDAKNRVRWQFGVLAPSGYVALDPSERDYLQADCLLEGTAPSVSVVVRFLHVQRRTVERAAADGFVPVEALDVGAATYLPWDEAVVHEATVPGIGTHDLDVPAATSVEPLYAPDGTALGRLVRERVPLHARLSAQISELPGPYGLRRLRLRLANRTDWQSPGDGTPDRPDALRHALVAAHLLISVTGGAFVSLIDPPEFARGAAAACEQVGCFPVLAGPPGERHLLLASPIILYDHPEVAPESPVQFCDATEMDELLTLRTLTLTEQEKRAVRGSDPRAAQLIDQLDDLPPALMDRLHGAIRSMTALPRPVDEPPPDEAVPWWDPLAEQAVDPDTDVVLVHGVPVGRGSAVRLRPGSRTADAQDMFLDGRSATVEAVLFDVDGDPHVAVSLDELAEDGHNPHGRYLYFAPDELEPIGGER